MKNIIFIAAALLIYGCAAQSENDSSQASENNEQILQLNEAQLKSFTVSFTEVQDVTISHTLRLNGMVDVPPRNLVSVSSAMGGYLQSTKLLAGMHFKKGEILAVMEDHQYVQLQQDYLTTKVQLENAESEYLRQKELNENKASSDKVFEKARSEYQSLRVVKKGLEEKLKMINLNPDRVSVDNITRTIHIYAPFDGYVTRVFVNTGKYIAPTDVMFELVDPRDLHLHLKVFEKDLDKIRTGQHLLAYTNSDPEKKHAGEIIMIGKNLSDDHAVEVHAHFEKHDDRLIPGLYMNAEIEIPENKVPALPDECILAFEGNQYVFKALPNNRFEMVYIQTGNSGNGWTEIKNPEKLSGQKIVREGAYTMLMALKNEIDD